MSEITYTDGTRVIFNTWNQCDCGSTGGCKKCQPFIYTPQMQKEDVELAEVGMDEYCKELERIDGEEYIIPEAREEKFLDKDLIKFYKKKGYKIQS